MADARRSPLIYRALALALGLVVAGVIGEVGLRLQARLGPGDRPPGSEWARWGQVPEFSGDCVQGVEQAKLGQILRPSTLAGAVFELVGGLDTCFEGARLTTTTDGLRAGAEPAVPKPERLHRIMILGDSQAFGWGVPLEATVGEQLEGVLSAGRDASIEVVNAAVPGYNTFQQAALFERLAPRYRPDCVLVLFTSNDLALPLFLLRPELTERPRSLLVSRVRLLTGSKRWFRFAQPDQIEFVTDLDLERVPEGYRHMVGVEAYRGALRRIAQTAGAVGATVVNAARYDQLPIDALEMAAFQRSVDIHLLDLTWPRGPELRLSDTDPHPSPLAHARFAETLRGELEAGGICLPPP